MDEIAKLVDVLKRFKPGHPLKYYITHATFPRFKNFEPGTRIDFDFPLTALVGANGIGKSSLLHALWGMPYGNSTSKFWFSTALDPIKDLRADVQRYFYGYWHDEYNGIVEARKARIGKKRDYWEPYRWSGNDGMVPMPDGEYEGKSKDRWNPVRRNVVYINSRALLGSFDRYFHFEDDQSQSVKRDRMLSAAIRLKKIKDGVRENYSFGGRPRVFENRTLTDEELQAVTKIIGRSYDGAVLIRHALYPGHRGRDLSVIFNCGMQYSEAFAGSGELSVVSIVVDVLAADQYSLILIDEPETSLHPGAQRALLKFLLEQIKVKKHQIVISTHSGEFLSGLPQEAIKVFEATERQQSRIIPRSSAAAAFNRLGILSPNKLRVIVEDELGKLIVERAIQEFDIGDRERIDVIVAPGGAEAIVKYIGPSAMAAKDNVCMLLDGDKKYVDSFTDPRTIAEADFPNLDALIKAELGTLPQYHIPGGNDKNGHQIAKVNAHLAYLAWIRTHLNYLPQPRPEIILLNAENPGRNFANLNGEESKAAMLDLLKEGADVKLSAQEIIAVAKIRIAKIPLDNQDFGLIRSIISGWLLNHNN